VRRAPSFFADGGRLACDRFKFCIRPVRVVVADAIARVTDCKHERFHAGQVNLTILRRVTGVHHAALPERLAVAAHDEFHAAAGFLFTSSSTPTLAENFCAPPSRLTRSMPSAWCPEAARKFFASHGQRVAVHRLVFMRVAPVLRGSGEIQLVQPDGFGGNDPDGEDDHGKTEREGKT